MAAASAAAATANSLIPDSVGEDMELLTENRVDPKAEKFQSSEPPKNFFEHDICTRSGLGQIYCQSVFAALTFVRADRPHVDQLLPDVSEKLIRGQG